MQVEGRSVNNAYTSGANGGLNMMAPLNNMAGNRLGVINSQWTILKDHQKKDIAFQRQKNIFKASLKKGLSKKQI
jgi:hypothetical protein